jgi:hypothetical protein
LNIKLVIFYLDSLWKFVLDNPEISIFLITSLGGGAVWLFRWWKNRKRKNATSPTAPPITRSFPFSPANEVEVWFVNVGERHCGNASTIGNRASVLLAM